MTSTITYSFEELPLVIECGFEAGLMNGHAEISYYRDGDWSVEAIYLDGSRKRSDAERATVQADGSKPGYYETKPIELDRGTSLFNTILHRLEHEWFVRVQGTVNDARFEDRVCAADDAADYRRERMWEAL